MLAITAALASVGALARPVQAAGESQDIVFLINSLGSNWIPNNSAISSFQGHVWGHVTDKLIYVDASGKVSPWIAETWQQSSDAREFTLNLKPGVTFSDGTPLDAAAVVANLDIWYAGRVKDGINPIGLFPKTYDRAEAVDATTVKVFFKAPTLGFIPTLGYHGSILISPKTIASPTAQQADLGQTSGSGPYLVAFWKEGDFVKLVKRKDYNWGPKAVGHTGPAFLDSITYKIVSEPSLRVSAVQSGQADIAYNAYNASPQELTSLKEAGFTMIEPDSFWATLFASVALGIPTSARIAEVLITNLDHESGQEYVAVARSRGLGQVRLFTKHLLKPSSLPVVTVIALTIGELLGGSLITETVFGRTGTGSLVQRSASTHDLPVLQAVVSLAAVVFVVVNLLADLVYPLLDPRMKLVGSPKRRPTTADDAVTSQAVA